MRRARTGFLCGSQRTSIRTGPLVVLQVCTSTFHQCVLDRSNFLDGNDKFQTGRHFRLFSYAGIPYPVTVRIAP